MNRSESWRSYPLVVLDCETGGLDPTTERVVELAAVRFEPGPDGYVITGTVASLVNPGRPIPKAASDIHGITDEMVAGAPTFAEVWPKVVALFGETTVAAAYNADFDRKFLRAEVERVREMGRDGSPTTMAQDLQKLAAVDLPAGLRLPWLDPLTWVREADRYQPGRGRHKLAVTCERWGVKLEDGHKAEDDAIAAGRLLTSDRMRRVIAEVCDGPDPSLMGVQAIQGTLAAVHDKEHQRFRQQMASNRGKAAQCKSCKAAIVWIETHDGKAMPIDAVPSTSKGTIVVNEAGTQGDVVAGEALDLLRAAGRQLFVSHFATCPQATQHRAPRR